MKKAEKIIGLIVAIVGVIAIAGYLIYNSLVVEVEVITLSEQSVERIIYCAGTVSAKENEIVNHFVIFFRIYTRKNTKFLRKNLY